jgi:hypothetical protein
MTHIRVSALALAIGLAAAPQLFAESRAELLVCRDGHVTSTRFGDGACARHHGVDRSATLAARRRAEYERTHTARANVDRGVYRAPATVGTVQGNAGRGVYTGTNGTVNGSPANQRGVYNGGVPVGTNLPVYRRPVNVPTTGTVHRDDDDDDDRGPGNHGRGHAYGHDKDKHDNGKHKGRDRDHDRDRDDR